MTREGLLALVGRLAHHEDVRLAIGGRPDVTDLPPIAKALRAVMKIDPVPEPEPPWRTNLTIQRRRVEEDELVRDFPVACAQHCPNDGKR